MSRPGPMTITLPFPTLDGRGALYTVKALERVGPLVIHHVVRMSPLTGAVKVYPKRWAVSHALTGFMVSPEIPSRRAAFAWAEHLTLSKHAALWRFTTWRGWQRQKRKYGHLLAPWKALNK